MSNAIEDVSEGLGRQERFVTSEMLTDQGGRRRMGCNHVVNFVDEVDPSSSVVDFRIRVRQFAIPLPLLRTAVVIRVEDGVKEEASLPSRE